ncbi:MAG: DUF411 domain-containing protein [Leptolyngbyaceae cyanobacterium]
MKSAIFKIIKIVSVSIVGVVTGLALVGCANPSMALTETTRPTRAVVGQELVVFRSPTCGCCGKWIEHMQSAGFTIKDEITSDMAGVKQRYGIPEELRTCHTAIAGNYIIEGHVPAEDVQRLLTETPAIAGIATPGMPIGSPGMESGNHIDPYTVVAFTVDGPLSRFASHP